MIRKALLPITVVSIALAGCANGNDDREPTGGLSSPDRPTAAVSTQNTRGPATQRTREPAQGVIIVDGTTVAGTVWLTVAPKGAPPIAVCWPQSIPEPEMPGVPNPPLPLTCREATPTDLDGKRIPNPGQGMARQYRVRGVAHVKNGSLTSLSGTILEGTPRHVESPQPFKSCGNRPWASDKTPSDVDTSAVLTVLNSDPAVTGSGFLPVKNRTVLAVASTTPDDSERRYATLWPNLCLVRSLQPKADAERQIHQLGLDDRLTANADPLGQVVVRGPYVTRAMITGDPEPSGPAISWQPALAPAQP